jgi:hypothetical protein
MPSGSPFQAEPGPDNTPPGGPQQPPAGQSSGTASQQGPQQQQPAPSVQLQQTKSWFKKVQEIISDIGEVENILNDLQRSALEVKASIPGDKQQFPGNALHLLVIASKSLLQAQDQFGQTLQTPKTEQIGEDVFTTDRPDSLAGTTNLYAQTLSIPYRNWTITRRPNSQNEMYELREIGVGIPYFVVRDPDGNFRSLSGNKETGDRVVGIFNSWMYNGKPAITRNESYTTADKLLAPDGNEPTRAGNWTGGPVAGMPEGVINRERGGKYRSRLSRLVNPMLLAGKGASKSEYTVHDHEGKVIHNINDLELAKRIAGHYEGKHKRNNKSPKGKKYNKEIFKVKHRITGREMPRITGKSISVNDSLDRCSKCLTNSLIFQVNEEKLTVLCGRCGYIGDVIGNNG